MSRSDGGEFLSWQVLLAVNAEGLQEIAQDHDQWVI